jgi:ATP-dependent DNA helicase RecG
VQSLAFEAEKLSNEGNLDDWENASIPNSGLIPIYPLTEGLSQKTFRKVIKIALSNYGKNIDNEIPDEIIKSRNLISKAKAISDIHLSNSMDEVLKAKETLIYEELYNFEYKMALRCLEHRGSLNHDSIELQKKISGDEFIKNLSPLQAKLLNKLEFSLTEDQMTVINQMNNEIDKSQKEFNTLRNLPENLSKNPFSMRTW